MHSLHAFIAASGAFGTLTFKIGGWPAYRLVRSSDRPRCAPRLPDGAYLVLPALSCVRCISPASNGRRGPIRPKSARNFVQR